MKSLSKKSLLALIQQRLVLSGLIVLLATPIAIQAQFIFTTNNGTAIITGYTGPGGAVTIPGTINGLTVVGIGTNAFFDTATLTNVAIGTNVLSLGNFAFEDCSNLASVTVDAGATNISVSLFQNCVSLTNITLPNTIKKIGTNAFYNCNSLAGVALPNSITNIANNAFEYCASLSSILLPTNLTSIGTSTFQNCSNLTSVGISNKVTSIGISAFANCTSLTNIILPSSLTTISSLAFQGCTSLTNITLPSSLSSFIAPVFLNCSSLTAINVNAANTFYSSVAGVLFNHSQTTLVEYPGGLGGSYTVPNSVTNIGTDAFESCSGLISVDITNNVGIIGVGAFENCTGLTNITISGSVTNIGSAAFEDCTSLAGITNLGSIRSIANDLFFGCTSLTNITIPGSVTIIGLAAFENCSNLASLMIPVGVVSLGQSAFQNCTSLTSITNLGSIISIANDLFFGCTSLTNVTIPGSVTSIGSAAFEGCTSLTFISLPKGLTTIATSVFQNCTSLVSITIPDNVTNFGNNAFNNCINLQAMYFQTNAPTLGNTVFSNDAATVYYLAGTTGWGATFGGLLAALDTINLDVSSTNGPAPLTVTFSVSNVDSASNLLTSWNWNFGDGTSSTDQNPSHTYTNSGSYSPVLTVTNSLGLQILAAGPQITASVASPFTFITNGNAITITGYTGPGGTVTIPDTINGLPVTGIGDFAFSNNTSLTSIMIGSGVTNIGLDPFYACYSLTNITVDAANPVFSSLNGVLFDSAQLTLIAFPPGLNGSYTIPDSVTSLGNSAFAGCGLTNVTIPNSVTNIGADAFQTCTSLTSVYFQGNAPPDTGNAFQGDLATVYYQAGATGWGSTFGGAPVVEICPAITVSPSTLPGGTTGVAYNQTTTATGGVAPYSFAVSSGSLPPGLSLSGGGVIAGTPTTAGAFNFIVTVPDANGCAGSSSYSINVVAPPPFTFITNGNAITITGYTGPGGTVTIPDTINGLPVTGIGDFAFSNNTSLTSIMIGSGVTNIGLDPFYACYSLTNITVDAANPVFSSLNGVLFDSAQLTLIAFPPGLNGSYTIPDSVTSLGNSAFAGCGLTNVTIPNSVTNIGADAFQTCTSLTSVYFQGNAPPDTGNAFQGDLATVYYQAGATGWGSTFGGVPVVEICPAIMVYPASTPPPDLLPGGTTGVAYSQTISALYGAAPYSFSVSSGSLPPGLSLSGGGVLAGNPTTAGVFNFTVTATDANGCAGSSSYSINVVAAPPFTYTINNTTITITGYTGPGGAVTIPGTINGLPVTSIGYEAFVGTSLSSVNIPDSVTSIGEFAFEGCSFLTAINVSANNPSFSSSGGVLFNKIQTTLVAYPGGLQGAYMIPNGTTSIADYAFADSFGLTSVTIPNSLTAIGSDDFGGCRFLTNFTVNANNPSYSSVGGVLFNQNQTTLVLFPENLGVSSYTIPNGVTSIGDYAFEYALSLSSVTIPNSVTTIGYESFVLSVGAIYFQGNAPSANPYAFAASSATAFYLPGTTGWGATYDGIRTELIGVSFNASLTNGLVPLAVNFTSPGIDGVGNSLIGWNWSFGDGSGSTAQNPSHVYAYPGTFTPTLTMTNNLGIAELGIGPQIVVTQMVTAASDFTYYNANNAITITGYNGTNSVVNIPDTIDGLPVTSIFGSGGFANDKNLNTVTIPGSLTYLIPVAFSGCTSLTAVNVYPNNTSYSSVAGVVFNHNQTALVLCPEGLSGSYTVPDSVTSIGEFAFAGCSGLTNLTIPYGVTSIGSAAFNYCTGLTSIILPDSITSIDGAFQDCTSLTNLTIPNGVTSIGPETFAYCGKLKTVTIHAGVTSIGDYAFYGCPSLTNLTIPDSVTSIGQLAFWACFSLNNLVISSNVTSIGANAFQACIGLESIYFQGNAPGADSSVFSDDTGTVYYLAGTTGWGTTFGGLPVTLETVSFNASSTNGVVPLVVNFTAPATDIAGDPLTSWNWNFGDGTTSTNQSPVHTYTNPGTFSPTLATTNSLSYEISGVGPQIAAYQAVTDFTYTINNGNIKITGYTGTNNAVTIPGSIYGMPVTEIGHEAFLGSSLNSVTIPDSVTAIRSQAFFSCPGLTSATLSTNLGSIGDQAFYSTSLTSINIPASVTSIGNQAFGFCQSLTNITVDGANLNYSSIGGVMFDKTQATLLQFPGGLGGNYNIPAGVQSIGGSAFYYCIQLTSVTMPNSVTEIGYEAFAACGLRSMTIPGSVTSIGDYAFDSAFLVSVYFDGNAPPDDGTIFAGDSETTVYYWYGTTGWGSTFGGVPAVLLNPPTQTPYTDASNFTYTTNYGVITITGYSGTNSNVVIPGAINGMAVTGVGQANSFDYVFEGAGVNSVIIPGTVTSIGEGAFAGTTLTNIIIPDSVKSIGTDAFLESRLNSVNFGTNVTTIGSLAFQSCASLMSVNLPDSVTSIGDYAFAFCSSLKSVTLGKHLTSIGGAPFAFCRSLTNISVTASNPAFSSLNGVLFDKTCSTLIQFPAGLGGSYSIPTSVSSIGEEAFAECSLTNVTIPDSVTSIGADAFAFCTGISAYFQGNAPLNDGTAFAGDNYNNPVHYLVGTTGWSSTYGGNPAQPQIAPGFNYAASNGSISIIGYTSTNSAVVIPDTLFGLPVRSIASRAFANVNYMTSVSVTTNVLSIGDGAFAGTGLKSVSISSNVIAIGNQVFEDCTSLTNITVDAANPNYSSAGGVLFDKSQSNLIQFPAGLGGSYIIPDGVTNIGDYSFAYSGLTDVTISATVTGIGANAFYDCPGLTNVFIPANVTSVGDEAFADCTSLTNIAVDASNPDFSSANGALLDKGQTTLIQFPAGLTSLTTFTGVTSVGASALAGCVNLTTLVIPDGIQIIGDPVFFDCTNLTSVSIPGSVTTIGLDAFANCTKLTNITVDAANPNFSSLNGVLFDKAQATLIQFPAGQGGGYTIPNTVTFIGNDAFNGCSSLTSVSIGSNVASIGTAAFAYCTSLTNMTVSVSNPNFSSSSGVLFDKLQKTLIGFPAGLAGSYKIPISVTNIEDQAFAGCNLTSVTIDANAFGIGDESFADCSGLSTVYFLGNAPALDLGTAFAGDNNSAAVYYLPGATGWNSGSFGGVPTMLWNPQKHAPGMIAGKFGFGITGPANAAIVIEACTNLINPVWLPVGTNVLDEIGNSTFTDSQWKNYAGRYYRFHAP